MRVSLEVRAFVHLCSNQYDKDKTPPLDLEGMVTTEALDTANTVATAPTGRSTVHAQPDWIANRCCLFATFLDGTRKHAPTGDYWTYGQYPAHRTTASIVISCMFNIPSCTLTRIHYYE